MGPVGRDEIKLSGAVMAHPKRMEEARRLAEADPRGRILVTTDPDPEGRPTALRTALVSWGCVAPDATHHLVLQDDVVLAEGFYEHAEQAAAAAPPGEAISLYGGWEARNGAVARLAALSGTTWAYTLQEHVPCQALMLPAELAREYGEYQEKHGGGWPYDVVVQRFLNERGVPVRFCTPSTVQHDALPSLAGNAYHGFRQATLFTGQVPRDAGAGDCPRFPVVPFYQYGDARCAVREVGAGTWEFIETERWLRRAGALRGCRAAYADEAHRPARQKLGERIADAVWLTGYATGIVLSDAAEPDRVTAAAVWETLGPGGLCEEYTAEELLAMAPTVRDLALAAMDEGRRVGGTLPRPAPAGHAVHVTGGAGGFGRQLAGTLTDLGFQVRQEGASYVVHLGTGTGDGLDEALTAAGAPGVERFVYVGSAAVYRGSAPDELTEDAVGPDAPRDEVARGWWEEERRCREWGESASVPVQVLRIADPVGPYAPASTACVRWVDLAWTRRPLLLDPQGVHQILDHRDLADALRAVLAAPPAEPVLNVASALHGEVELAGLLADVSRRTPWEWSQQPLSPRWSMATGLIERELGWRPTARVMEAMRALAQWYACDIHGDYDEKADAAETAVASLDA
ncbi:NAD-dependent epimerase/dehydratase family protein [Streptomyces yaanensis]|uniref:NAD-dependent epimerase/dehydratase family protein n=1 Tax=Streptomyces yaanensis TaxID=1142239 RepID=A0ABV7SFM2_9ACTN|nr:NAD(P)-dependent oxidoreductase [Streptomyces sp. CGMCC 4.7035]WNB98697.1 NAD(P)-dependent oxidoreductase [Streptomyces sp. CGMCC 4.7035]